MEALKSWYAGRAWCGAAATAPTIKLATKTLYVIHPPSCYDGGVGVTARGVVWDTTTEPTVRLATKTTDDKGTGEFTSKLKALKANTTYYLEPPTSLDYSPAL